MNPTNNDHWVTESKAYIARVASRAYVASISHTAIAGTGIIRVVIAVVKLS